MATTCFVSLIIPQIFACTDSASETVFNQLQGAKLLALRADMEQNYPILRRTSYGKQVIAIEKLLFGPNGPPPLPPASTGSSGSSNLPSTNPSSTTGSDGAPARQVDIK